MTRRRICAGGVFNAVLPGRSFLERLRRSPLPESSSVLTLASHRAGHMIARFEHLAASVGFTSGFM